MADDSSTGTMREAVSAGAAGLADAVTSALDKSGPVGLLAKPVVGALRNVWEGYFGAPVPPGATNWNAYTHAQLREMLWQGADVGDVSSVAAEWDRHGTELTGHSDTLRGQRTALSGNWSGRAAEPAADRLGALGERTSDIGNRAGTVGKATQDAGDALAVARNTMPPPPGDPTGLAVSGALAGAGAGAAIGGVLGAGAGGIGAGPGALMGAAIGAVAGGGGSLFLANVAAAERKAEAVHVMQRYETSLRDSSHKVAGVPKGSTGTVLSGAGEQTTGASSAIAGGAAGGGAALAGGEVAGRGPSWAQLTGAGAMGAGVASGLRTGAGALNRAMLARQAAMNQLAAARAAGGGGLYPPGARGQGGEDQVHENRLPTIDQNLFGVDALASEPVIGL
ncbi:hypothetical protein [Amycolatopsis minnesotensis]|uniref:Outer membrane channel protein CpnT-like N-terminal domain-containing protein n=1 Tax=Amycolatopsis minnesotensis TaxID=337894 RepID=A0ABN2SL55_9PSEU